LMDGRGVLLDGRLRGRAGPRGPFEATIAPEGAGRTLRLVAEDAGALLHAFDVLRHLEGGRLNVTASYAHNGRGAPLSGTAEMSDFVVHNAPAFAKLLQAMTLYGLVEAVSGPGLNFARLVAPFTLSPEALTLEDARAFSASLGLTARGTLDRRRQRVAMEGTIVPAYIFNSLLGNIPILGRLFSPEAGGGVFAATFRLQGALDDPQVSVNPLAALTPGFLRGLFGLGQQPAQ
uniref:AsmA-like C-terminal region-containing protein n=1 Tax=Falsiroseomonas oryziterrae TaxID=2911368 RepID=UPI001F46590D